MNEFKIKRKKERNVVWILNFLKCFLFAFGALLIICVSTGGRLFTFKHVIIYSIYSLPLCFLYALTVDRLGGGLGTILSGWSSRRVSPRETLSADLERARFSKRNGRFQEGLRIIDDVLQKDRNFPEALFLKAQILWEGFENREGAVECLEKVMGLVQEEEPIHRWSLHYYLEVKKGHKIKR